MVSVKDIQLAISGVANEPIAELLRVDNLSNVFYKLTARPVTFGSCQHEIVCLESGGAFIPHFSKRLICFAFLNSKVARHVSVKPISTILKSHVKNLFSKFCIRHLAHELKSHSSWIYAFYFKADHNSVEVFSCHLLKKLLTWFTFLDSKSTISSLVWLNLQYQYSFWLD